MPSKGKHTPTRQGNQSPRRTITPGRTPSTSNTRRKQTNPIRRPNKTNLALKEIRYFMQTTHLLIPRLPFCRLVRDICLHLAPHSNEFRWQKAAMDCLQEAAEAYIVGTLSDANLCALHAKRVTLMPRDLRLIMRLRGPL